MKSVKKKKPIKKKTKCKHLISFFDPKKIKMICASCGFESDDF